MVPSSALPPKETHDASPKAISERTSYYQVRLAFHSLPQVIRDYCTGHRFGPPSIFRQTSSCSWQAHLASGLTCTTNALFTLGFPLAPPFGGLACSARQLVGSFFNRHAVTDRINTSAPTPCKYMVSGLFHSPHRGSFHLSLTVLVHYRSQNVFSLTG